ncbi:hypothetical protein BX600DRAFT_459169 [Xylariales sp. PMI_506]|nr:hypothetical protein BX600DRAFT_459169 [Xylariales sp. PMI_506]
MAERDAAYASFERMQNHLKNVVLMTEKSDGMMIHISNHRVTYVPKKPFLRNGRAAYLLSPENLRGEAFREILYPPAAAERTYLADILERTGSEIRLTLLIILCLGNLEMLEAFELRFLTRSCGKSDRDLPFEEDVARDIFGHNGNDFFKIQFPFLAITIDEGTFRKDYQYLRCLPYLEHNEIGRGAYGTVFKVKIERGHFRYRQPKSRNKDPVYLVRKDFRPNAESYDAFKAEDFILKDLINSSNCPSSIMTSISSYIQTSSDESVKYPCSSIFFPPARCNLYAYLTNPAEFPGPSYTMRLQHMRQMVGISEGLKWLTSLRQVYVSTEDKWVFATYYHCDLKPENILVCDDPDKGPGSVVFKIADFGQARRMLRAAEGPARPPEHSIPVTGREAIYLAPEVQDLNERPQVRARSDVWAFGCIFLLVILFNYEGARGVEEFRRRREVDSSAKHKGGHFFGNVDGRGADIRNPAVTATIEKLLTNTEERSITEIDGRFSNRSLRYLEDHILVRYKDRHTIEAVANNLRDYYNDRSSHRPREIKYKDVPRNAKHCSTSPGGLVFYYDPELIRVYSNDPNPVHSIRPSTSESLWSGRHLPTSRSCTKDYLCLVPVEQGQGFKFTLHPMTPKSVEPRMFTIQTRRRSDSTITPEPSVQKIALSPDGTMLAVACKVSKSEARVYLYNITIDDTASISIASSALPNHSVLDTGEDLLSSSGHMTRANYTIDLCFSSDGTTLYHALRLQSQKPQVKVTAWRTRTGTKITSCNIEDKDADYEGHFLTNIYPLNAEVGFLAITYNHSIIKQSLHGKYFTGDPINIRISAQLQTLLVSADDRKIVILAKAERKHLEIWGCSSDSLEAPRKLKIDGKVYYHPESDSAVLVEEDGNMRLHLATLKDKNLLKYDLDWLFEREQV